MQLSKSIFSKKYRLFILLIGMCCLFGEVDAQVYIGYNFGSGVGRTLDAQLHVYPKNEDWISVFAGGGYTIPGPFFLTPKADSITGGQNSGWHSRLGARIGLTTDHHGDHLFFGSNLVFAGYKESGTRNLETEYMRKGISVGVGIFAGYSLRLFKKSVNNKLSIDLGFQAGVPFYSSAGFEGTYNYIPGLGYGFSKAPGLHGELLVLLKYELYHPPYGYRKIRKVKKFK